MAQVGDKIRILGMVGEPQYIGKEGTVTKIAKTPWGEMLYGTWGGCAVMPADGDVYEVIK